MPDNMSRIDFNELTDQHVAARRAAILGSADVDYAEIPPEVRPNRADRSDLGALKDNDDVVIQGGKKGRVVCPAAGLGWVFIWSWDILEGWMESPVQAINVIDRAPADPMETAMPIFPEPENPDPLG